MYGVRTLTVGNVGAQLTGSKHAMAFHRLQRVLEQSLLCFRSLLLESKIDMSETCLKCY